MYSAKKIKEIQQEYKDKCSLNETTIEGKQIIYRTIDVGTYNLLLLLNLSEVEFEDQVVANCVVYPESLDTDDMYAGSVTELAHEILEHSCVKVDDRIALMQLYRDVIGKLDDQMMCIILKAFPGYKLTDLKKMDYTNFIELYTKAEWTLDNLGEYNLQSVYDPVELLNNSLAPSSDLEEIKNEILKNNDNNEYVQQTNSTQEKHSYIGRSLDDVMSEINNKNNNSQRKEMTPEQKRAFENFKRKFPEMNMEYDSMFTGSNTMTASTIAPANRVMHSNLGDERGIKK